MKKNNNAITMTGGTPETTNNNSKEIITEEMVLKYVKTFLPVKDFEDNEILQFITMAKMLQLNPFKKEIYPVAYGKGEYRQFSLVTGYSVYLKRAEKLHKLNGWKCYTKGTEEDLKAIIEIHRIDWQHPFYHEVFLNECQQSKKDGTITKFWTKMPKFMLKKVCISQGFRLCFPAEFEDLPYIEEEINYLIESKNQQQSFTLSKRLKNKQLENKTPAIIEDNTDNPPAEEKIDFKQLLLDEVNDLASKQIILSEIQKQHFKDLFYSTAEYTEANYNDDRLLLESIRNQTQTLPENSYKQIELKRKKLFKELTPYYNNMKTEDIKYFTDLKNLPIEQFNDALQKEAEDKALKIINDIHQLTVDTQAFNPNKSLRELQQMTVPIYSKFTFDEKKYFSDLKVKPLTLNKYNEAITKITEIKERNETNSEIKQETVIEKESHEIEFHLPDNNKEENLKLPPGVV